MRNLCAKDNSFLLFLSFYAAPFLCFYAALFLWAYARFYACCF